MKSLVAVLDNQVSPRPLTPVRQRLVNASVAIRAEPPPRIDYLHTVFCQCPLPYKRPRARLWERRQGQAFLRLQAGSALDPRTDSFVELGLPYGEKPRLLLIHLTGEALRTGSPEIEVEDSMTAFMRTIGLDTGGRARGRFRDQLARLAASSVQIAVPLGGNHSHNVAARFISEFDLWWPGDAAQQVLWSSTVRLSPEYFESLKAHAVPFDCRAIGALKHSALALDLYVWLTQRLVRIRPTKPNFVPWSCLREQFSSSQGRMPDFRRSFLEALNQVLVVYPSAKLEVVEGKGLRLHQSPPPVPVRQPRLL